MMEKPVNQGASTRLPVWRQLRWNLVTFFVFLAVVPLVIVAFIIIQQTDTRLREQVFNQLASVAELKTTQIRDWLDDGEQAIAGLTANRTSYDWMVWTLTGDESLAATPELVGQRFREALVSQPSLDEIFLYDLDGNIVAASAEISVGKIVTRQPYFAGSLTTDLLIQPPYYDVGRGDLTVIVTSIVLDPSGEPIGVLAIRPDIETLGCDINRFHIGWIARHLPANITAFQSHSIPSLPLPDDSVDLMSAFSVFTHIEALETAWLMELRRILRPGGIAWITVHSEKTWDDLNETWPLYGALRNHPDFDTSLPRRPMTRDRMVFRWRSDKSYTANVFYTFDYIRRAWGRIFDVVETHRRLPAFQDVIVLSKPT